MSEEPSPLLTQRAAARLLGIHLITLRRYVRAGAVRGIQVGRRVQIAPEELERIRRDGLPVLPVSPKGSQSATTSDQ